ncbi:MAG: aminopeptidase [Oscillospiraceae bacterium]|nr:aminopeptidase [Oscillospiraceae bacterium]
MDVEIILFGMLIVSTLTGLATEALKKLLTEYNRSYHANMLADGVSLVISVAVVIGYVVLTETPWSGQIIVTGVVLVFLSWLCAMVGYDKVIQTISQIKKDD